MKKRSKLLALALTVASCAMSQQAGAVPTVWDYTSNNVAATVDGVTGTFVGYYQSGTLLTAQPTETYGTNGVGNCSVGENCSNIPQHANDNSGNLEGLLLTFTKDVNLTNVKLGYTQEQTGVSSTGSPIYANRADFSLLAYVGTGSQTPSLAGKSFSQLLTSGWAVIGNYGNIVAGTNTAITTATNSSYWLIAAYNSMFSGGSQVCSNGSTACTNAGATSGADFFKVAAISGTVAPPGTNVPEPSSMALLGVSLIGALALRRRQKSDAS